MGFEKLKAKLLEERGKPLRVNLMGVLQGAFVILAFVLVVLLTFYILRNIHLLQADPCKLCEGIGFTCVRGVIGG